MRLQFAGFFFYALGGVGEGGGMRSKLAHTYMSRGEGSMHTRSKRPAGLRMYRGSIKGLLKRY
jgi:hypothetical protein